MKKNKKLDCVGLKRLGANVVYEQTKNMSLEAELAYWQQKTEQLKHQQQATKPLKHQ
jgi:hypothetical protein